jgi:hypothetical protein
MEAGVPKACGTIPMGRAIDLLTIFGRIGMLFGSASPVHFLFQADIARIADN